MLLEIGGLVLVSWEPVDQVVLGWVSNESIHKDLSSELVRNCLLYTSDAADE